MTSHEPAAQMPALQKGRYSRTRVLCMCTYLVDTAGRENKPIKACIRHVMLMALRQPMQTLQMGGTRSEARDSSKL